MNNINIGQKIEDFRKSQNLTMRKLAEKSDITPSMLSQIERNLANPSINTLKRIAQALDVPMYHFFITDDIQSDLVVRSDKRAQLPSDLGDKVKYYLLTPDNKGTIEFTLIVLSPSKEDDWVSQSHSGEEVAFILSGNPDIVIDDTTYSLNPGDSIRIPAHSPHIWKNATTNIAEIIYALSV